MHLLKFVLLHGETVHVFQIMYGVPFSVTAELTADTGGDQGLC